ncbi:carbohydrate kinase family protein [Homoserinibacter sp. YIM 151385]|uniref:carbohydrate kinase family protein n=1 Tax=Homoserinibacter sp. YIM 151385 TaxID=2985506 RepID=UPI0022F0BC59|nr:PfkB family carbohydrate kinase [Homoserinibacter sp. YIM 151385]WBU37045.1 PfkB family carbohydrate kinase [Homoserinibacter sp. YIM 151385]
MTSRERIVVVGDLLNDIVAVPRGGFQRNTDTTASIRQRPGGSGANTAAWLASLGADVDYVGAVGSADAARHRQMFADAGVRAHLQVEVGVPTGTVVIVIEGDRRTMLTERGANALLDTAALTPALLETASVVHLSAYSFLDGFGVEGAREIVDAATAAGVPVALNPGSIGYLRDFGVPAFREATEGVRVIFPNLVEAELLTGERTPARMVASLLERHEVVALTMGAEGVLAARRGEEPRRTPAPRVRLVDPTGAGDAFAAGFLHRWAQDGDVDAAAASGVMVAARAVLAIGGRPPF